MEANNMAAMREACQKMLDLLMLRGDGKAQCVLTWDEFNDSQKMLRAALSAPPRQCDIGTAEEQDDRWESFCASHHSPWKITGGTGTMICDCPCYKGNNKCNRFVWAQMPYAEEGGQS